MKQAAWRACDEFATGILDNAASRLTESSPLSSATLTCARRCAPEAADDYETLRSYFPNLELVSISRAVLLGSAALRARQSLLLTDLSA